MKETTKMSRAVGQLEKMYNTINADLFGSELPTPIITVQSKPGTYGHCSCAKVWRNKDTEQYEMNIAAEERHTGGKPGRKIPQREIQSTGRGKRACMLQGRSIRLEHTGQGERQIDRIRP